MRNTLTKPLWAVAAISLLALAGCNQIDPLTRPYMWEESGVNAHNVAAMAANPADLTHGRDAPQRRVSVESDPVDHLWAGKPTPLLTSGSTGSTGTSGAPATSGGN
jgi:type IV pilus biogenesis protein CpaD/CtpE